MVRVLLCLTAESDKSCFLSTLTPFTMNSERVKKRKKKIEKYLDPLWTDGARHSVVTVSHKQAHGRHKDSNQS